MHRACVLVATCYAVLTALGSRSGYVAAASPAVTPLDVPATHFYVDGKRPPGTLLLNMLIKNEEEHLARTLPRWAKIIDAWVIGVDDANTDSSPEVIRRALGRIPGKIVTVHFDGMGPTWTQLVKAGWESYPNVTHGILADADFAPMVDSFDKMELDIRCSKHIYTIYTADHANARKLDWIYRNMPGVDVRRRTHQALHAPPIPEQDMFITEVNSLTIDEAPGGYQDRTGGSKGKARRYIEMLEADLRDYGDNDARSLYYLGIGHFDLFAAALQEQGRAGLLPEDWEALAAGVRYMERRVALPPVDDVGKREERWFALLKLGEAHERWYGDNDAAMQAYLHAARLDPERADAWFYAGQNLRLRGRAVAGLPLLLHAASLPQPDRALFHWRLMYSCLPALEVVRAANYALTVENAPSTSSSSSSTSASSGSASGSPGVWVSDVLAGVGPSSGSGSGPAAAAAKPTRDPDVWSEFEDDEDEDEHDDNADGNGDSKSSSSGSTSAAAAAAARGTLADPAFAAERSTALSAMAALLAPHKLRGPGERSHSDVLRAPMAPQAVLESYVAAAVAMPPSLHMIDAAIEAGVRAVPSCRHNGEHGMAGEIENTLATLRREREAIAAPGSARVLSAAEWRRRQPAPTTPSTAASGAGSGSRSSGPGSSGSGSGSGGSSGSKSSASSAGSASSSGSPSSSSSRATPGGVRVKPLPLVTLPSAAALAPLPVTRNVPFLENESPHEIAAAAAAQRVAGGLAARDVMLRLQLASLAARMLDFSVTLPPQDRDAEALLKAAAGADNTAANGGNRLTAAGRAMCLHVASMPVPDAGAGADAVVASIASVIGSGASANASAFADALSDCAAFLEHGPVASPKDAAARIARVIATAYEGPRSQARPAQRALDLLQRTAAAASAAGARAAAFLDDAAHSPAVHVLRLQLRDVLRALQRQYISRRISCRTARVLLRPLARSFAGLAALADAQLADTSEDPDLLRIRAGAMRAQRWVAAALEPCTL